MKSIFIIILLTLFILPTNAQDLTPEKQFIRDLENNTIHLYFLSSCALMHYENDAEFQKKYNVIFHDFGCMGPPNLSFYSDYNLLVFDYLQKTRGNVWEGEIRKHVLGWSQWKPETADSIKK